MAYRKYFTVSFDDGLEQDKRLIRLMHKYGIKGTFNLNAGLLGERGTVKRIGNLGYKDCPADMQDGRIFKYAPHNRIPRDEIREVYEGMEVASHSYRHEVLGRLPVSAMKESIDRDVAELEQIVGYKIVGHAYPFGSSSVETQNYLREKGMLYGRGVLTGNGFSFPENPWNLRPVCSHISKNVFELLARFRDAVPEQDDLLFYIWGHGYECDYGSREASWDKTERIFASIAGRNDVEYVTNAEAFRLHDEHGHG